MSFWYHFAILFEALFILTTIDAGTRVARFMIQDLVGTFVRPSADAAHGSPISPRPAIAVTGWGYFLYQGVIDPLGGINTLWPLFGIANQMLAAMALTLCVVVLFRMKRERYAVVALAPMAWLYICTAHGGPRENLLTTIRASAFSPMPASLRRRRSTKDKLLAPAKTLDGNASHDLQRLCRRRALRAFTSRWCCRCWASRLRAIRARAAPRGRHHKGERG